ncbi:MULTISPECIES: hypothetical protein [unclassified Streptomyces]|uniref:hypothetical protein n=1 Tax=unclassified Streptomyces TaxID=2593676 RepID=UPI003817F96F
MSTKGWSIGVVAWNVLAALLLGTTVWVGALGFVRLGLAGDEVRVRLAHCQPKGGGAAGATSSAPVNWWATWTGTP